jgi:hypothetical protein
VPTYLSRPLPAPLQDLPRAVVLVEDLLLQDLLDHVLQGDDPQGHRLPGRRLVVGDTAGAGEGSGLSL